MKIKLTFKTPDVLDQLNTRAYNDNDFIDDETAEQIRHTSVLLSKWIKWSEYLTVEFDLENQTAKVLEV